MFSRRPVLSRLTELARRPAFLIVAVPPLIFFLLNLIFPLPMDKLNRKPSEAVYSEDGRLLKVFLSSDGYWRMKTGLKDVSPFLREAVLAYEDKWFYLHPGVNPVSMARAAVVNVKRRRIVCGGSTITMQVARMIEPKRRTYLSKLIEIFRAAQLELKYSKNEILEFYFNLAPYGGNIEGVGAASYFYFGKPASALSRAEAVSLVVIPNSPTRLRPDLNYEEYKAKRRKVAEILLKRNLIGRDDFAAIDAEENPRGRAVPPSFAPHFAQFVKDKYHGGPNLVTTLDPHVQRLCEELLRRHIGPLRAQGITNGAVVVIDNRTRSVLAMVGSADFGDARNSGQVNGALAPRSPGSALKPFAYAVALDAGIISPKLLLPDVPVDYSGYTPVNFDEKYHGGVPAEEALKQSLNVPAVNLVAGLKDRFYSFLRKGGVTTLTKPREYYGLPIVLGGCEVNLLEITNLYATLANGGMYQPFRLLKGEKTDAPKRALSKAAAYIISDILSEVRRPDLPNCWEFTVDLPRVAWKTGTSYGRRDAWSVGYNPEYTVGVWIGNFNGREAERLVGAEVAAPLLFDIFNALSNSGAWFGKPPSVGVRKVCPLSGRLATENCPETVDELYIYGVSPTAQCDMHRKFYIDDETGLRLSKSCRAGRGYKEKLFVIWPREIAMWMKREGWPVEDVPEYRKDCGAFASGQAPVIISPQADVEYYMRDDAPAEHQKIPLDAAVSNTVNKVFWFVDGEMLASGPPTEKHFYFPARGRHRIICMDSEGYSSAVTININ